MSSPRFEHATDAQLGQEFPACVGVEHVRLDAGHKHVHPVFGHDPGQPGVVAGIARVRGLFEGVGPGLAHGVGIDVRADAPAGDGTQAQAADNTVADDRAHARDQDRGHRPAPSPMTWRTAATMCGTSG